MSTSNMTQAEAVIWSAYRREEDRLKAERDGRSNVDDVGDRLRREARDNALAKVKQQAEEDTAKLKQLHANSVALVDAKYMEHERGLWHAAGRGTDEEFKKWWRLEKCPEYVRADVDKIVAFTHASLYGDL